MVVQICSKTYWVKGNNKSSLWSWKKNMIQNPESTWKKSGAYLVYAKSKENALSSVSEFPGKPCHPCLRKPFSRKVSTFLLCFSLIPPRYIIHTKIRIFELTISCNVKNKEKLNKIKRQMNWNSKKSPQWLTHYRKHWLKSSDSRNNGI